MKTTEQPWPCRIYDPENPNLHGYALLKPSSRWIEFLWWLYGPGIVAQYLHRQFTAGGRVQNWLARRILNHLFNARSK